MRTTRDAAGTAVAVLWALILWHIYWHVSDILAYTLVVVTLAVWIGLSADLADREAGRSTPLVPWSKKGGDL